MDIEIILAVMGIVGGAVGAWSYRGRKSIDIKYEREVGINAQIKGLLQVITSQAEVNREQQVINSSMQGKMDAILEADRANVQTLLKEGYDLGGKILQRIDDTHPRLVKAVSAANQDLLKTMGETISEAITDGIKRSQDSGILSHNDERWETRKIITMSKGSNNAYIYSKPDYHERKIPDQRYFVQDLEEAEVIRDAREGFHAIRVERNGEMIYGWILATSVRLAEKPTDTPPPDENGGEGAAA